MDINTKYKIQLILFVVYISLTILFFIGYVDTMIKPFLPYSLGDLFALFTMIYLGFAIYAIPIFWFVIIIYNYQVYPPKENELEFKSFKEVFNKYAFPIACFLNVVLTSIYLINLSQDYDYYVKEFTWIIIGFGLLLFCFYVVFNKITRNNNVNLSIRILGLFSLVLLIGYFFIIANVEFAEFRINEELFMFSLEYNTIYYIMILMIVFYVLFLLYGFINVKKRIKLFNLMFYISFFFYVIFNFINTISLLNYLDFIRLFE